MDESDIIESPDEQQLKMFDDKRFVNYYLELTKTWIIYNYEEIWPILRASEPTFGLRGIWVSIFSKKENYIGAGSS